MYSIVKEVMEPPSFSLKRPADFPPADKSAKILLPDEQLTMLSSNMDEHARRVGWQAQVDKAEADDSEVGYTSGRFDFPHRGIGVHKHERQGYRKCGLSPRKAGVWDGVKEKNWNSLLACRTYIPDYQII
ncbi:hypothetical protein AX15_007397 [Amanita polypyramis BW_CC]|nr:hypothetical protein AX15_007397 [Amanita polypyramis BW_CC]